MRSRSTLAVRDSRKVTAEEIRAVSVPSNRCADRVSKPSHAAASPGNASRNAAISVSMASTFGALATVHVTAARMARQASAAIPAWE
ncbi:hypothetical protein [Amycolatopsis eburnea]|uniref:Uncharacterized protein n=1 Tax=Amycolatopsis eburnea TaxID=2267691 RepID=A0A427SU24_9PSEU|nr:hypothetical protein [Amycolatopsis eburnea]RSD07250.1 hypothetical protein EIY87_46185 [Amycolatopsis eburnea]